EDEFSLAAELDPAWAAKPLALTRHKGRTILVLTDPGGEPLDLVLERGPGQPLDLTRVLRIAIGLATTLSQVHRRGLIHKDIKPANVLVDDSGNVCLTGFGIASQLPHETQAPAPPEIIAGTLAYMSPEQTASGLEADLRRCLGEWQSHGRIDPFPLGAHDSSDRLLIPEKLYGREREVDALLGAFDRVMAQGIPALVLVFGYSGVGKSSV